MFRQIDTDAFFRVSKSLDNNSSSACSEISVKLFRAGGNNMLEIVVHLFNLILTTSKFSVDLKKALVTPLFKRKGMRTQL
jgi:hypothetical protein